MIAAYVLQRSAEEALRAAVQTTPTGTFLNLSDDEARSLVGQIERALAATSAGVLPVVLSAMDVRRHMRSLLAHNGIELPVLSYQELAPEFNVQPLATITSPQPSRGRRPPSQALPAARAETGT